MTITLCVPTMNRPRFLERLLRYYAMAGYTGWIFIGDSSRPELGERTRRIVGSFDGALQLLYRCYPDVSACACLEQLSQMVATPYCAFLGDDDFLCLRGLEACVAYLEAHPECGAAHGAGLMLQTEGGGPYGPLGSVRPYPQAVVTSPTGSERLRECLTVSRSSVLYSVHRTDTWRAMFRGLGALPGVNNRNMFKDELIPTAVSVIRGPVKALEALSLIRHVHADDSYRFPHVYDWLTDPHWFPSYQVFHRRLAEELIRQDRLRAEDADAAVRAAFWPYLAREVGVTRRKELAAGTPRSSSRLRRLAKRLPGARAAWRALRAPLQAARDPWSLPALLEPTAPAHADFMPVYRLITSSPPSDPSPREGAGRVELVAHGA